MKYLSFLLVPLMLTGCTFTMSLSRLQTAEQPAQEEVSVQPPVKAPVV